MAADYTAYPNATDVTNLLTAANITLGSGVTTDIINRKIQAAISELEYSTGIKFASVTETRYFDGSGTGIMDVDYFVSLTDISFYALPAQSTVQISNWKEVSKSPYGKSRIQIYQGPANMPVGWWTNFPVGRSNVAITGTWGFTNIPALVWEGICGKAASGVAETARATPNGILTGLKDLDQSFAWSDKQIGELAGWNETFERAKTVFRRPLRAFLSVNKPRYI